MTLNSSISDPQNPSIYSIVYGDCIQAMHQLNDQSVDFILTDPHIWSIIETAVGHPQRR